MNHHAQSRQVDANRAAFQRMLSVILRSHRDEYALMRDGEVVAYFTQVGDAYRAGMARFRDALFSIQEVTDQPIDRPADHPLRADPAARSARRMRSLQATALVDSGATTSGIVPRPIRGLGLVSYGKRPLESARDEHQLSRDPFRLGFVPDAAGAMPFVFERSRVSRCERHSSLTF